MCVAVNVAANNRNETKWNGNKLAANDLLRVAQRNILQMMPQL